MKHARIIVAAGLVMLAGLAGGSALAASDVPDPGALGAANNALALDLYRQLAQEPGNLFFSPFSVEVALAMTMAGARGETAAQMQSVLRLPGNDPALHEAVGAWQQAVVPAADDSLLTFTVANRLWGQQGIRFTPPFLDLTRRHYGAELGQVDFARDPVGAAEAINHWVEQQTRGRIKDLVPPGVLGPQTPLVLTNAVYFLGTWLHPFSEKSTGDDAFHLAGGGEVRVPTMVQTERFAYAEDDEAQVLELPYRAQQGPSYAMVIVVPRQRDGLARVAGALTEESLAASLAALRPRRVEVHLPRFEMTGEMSLRPTLAALGMPLAFSGSADFSGMLASDQGPAISDVLHKGFVKIDEKGTEAAAATAVVMKTTSVERPEEPVVVRADRPFLLLIRERTSGTILFMGRVADPRA